MTSTEIDEMTETTTTPNTPAHATTTTTRTPAPLPNAGPMPVVVIRPRSGWQPVNLAELWDARELLFFLALRDVKVKYKQSVLGIAWAVIVPFFNSVVSTVLLGYFGGFNKKISGEVPYFVLTFCAQVPWQLFANAMTNAGNSLITNQNLITKVYFPRLAVPISAVLAGMVDFFICLVILAGMMAFWGIVPPWQVVFAPFFAALGLVAAVGIGVFLSAVNVTYRDVRYVIPFLTQIWMTITPVAYPITIVPEKWRTLYALNPMVGVIEGFKWSVLGTSDRPGPMVLVSSAVAGLVLIGAMFYFRKTEKSFADNI